MLEMICYFAEIMAWLEMTLGAGVDLGLELISSAYHDQVVEPETQQYLLQKE